jgi:hypothetical protein
MSLKRAEGIFNHLWNWIQSGQSGKAGNVFRHQKLEGFQDKRVLDTGHRDQRLTVCSALNLN